MPPRKGHGEEQIVYSYNRSIALVAAAMAFGMLMSANLTSQI